MDEGDVSRSEEFDFARVFDVNDYLYFYRESLTDERTEKEVNALVKLLALDVPKKILDLACGFGRHTNRLAELGHLMTGVDISPGFLEIAKANAVKKGIDVNYQQNDMRRISYINEFDRVMLLFTSFGYFSDDENLRVLVNTTNALISGGLLIFDSMNRDTMFKTMKQYDVVEKEGNIMIDRNYFDSVQGRFYNKRIIYRNGIRKNLPFFIRLYNPNEIHELTHQAGLEIEHIYGSWEATELSADSRRMIVIARKP